MKIRLFLTLALFVAGTMCLPQPGWTRDIAEFTAPVVGVADGDTLTILYQGKQTKIRLAEVDCPELKGQAFGHAAKEFVLGLVAQKTVRVRQVTTDRYDRLVAEVFLPDGRSLNHLLVSQGLAWWYRAYSTDQTLAQAEQAARSQRLGLWIEPHPIPPWEFRKQKRASERNGKDRG